MSEQLEKRIEHLESLIGNLLASTPGPFPADQLDTLAGEVKHLGRQIEGTRTDVNGLEWRIASKAASQATDAARTEMAAIAEGTAEALSDSMISTAKRLDTRIDQSLAEVATDVARTKAVAAAQTEIAAEFLRAGAYAYGHGQTGE